METNFTYTGDYRSNKAKNKKLGCGCGSILLLVALILAYFFSYHLIFPSLFPKWIRGSVQNLAVFPSKDGNKLWIQNDGSFSYISESKSGGSYSVGSSGFFCKALTYVYDPNSKKVVEGFKTDFDYLPQTPEIIYDSGKVWVIASLNGPAYIKAYSADTYQEVINTQSFCNKNKDLAAGIDKIYVDRSLPVRLNITTKDGRNVVYCLKEDKFYPNFGAMQRYYEEHDSSRASIFTLENEQSSNKRKNLYFISGLKSDLYFSSPKGARIIEDKGRNKNNLSAAMLLPDRAFIEGELLYFDDEIAVIIHQDNVGKNANRMLTCVDKSGKELWTIPPGELFDDIKATEKNSFSDMFFMKDKFAVQRAGNTVVFIFKPEGAIGFDLSSGKKLWTYED